MKKYAILLFLLIFISNLCFSDDPETNNWELQNHSGFGNAAMHGLIGAGEIILSNALLTVGNYVGGFEWALPKASSIRYNYTHPWKWERGDGHIVNSIGHPYQGALYFSAGRANHYGFYQSTLFSAFGSVFWETLCEQQHAGMNDFIVTSVGSAAFGEILYRLYTEARLSGIPAPLAFIINPIAGFHSLITGWKPTGGGGNIYDFSSYIGATYSTITYDRKDLNESIFSFDGFTGEIGVNVIYGNPFETETRVPFRHFEFDVSFGMQPLNYNNIRFIMDGYLLSFAPVYTEKSRMSTGLSLHLDFLSVGKWDIQDSTIDMSSNALNWTIKYQHLFSEKTSAHIKFHAGFTFFGQSEYYTPLDPKSLDWGPDVPTTGRNALKTFNYGINSKLYLGFRNKTIGDIDASIFYYLMRPYPGTSEFTDGYIQWIITDFTYSHLVAKHIALGVTNTFSMERGTFKKKYSYFPLDTHKWGNSVMLFVAWKK